MEILRNLKHITMFRAYSGTTIENFGTCAVIKGNHVKFEKAKESRYYEPKNFWYAVNFDYAAHFALRIAWELKHTPLIMEVGISRLDVLGRIVGYGPISQWMLSPVRRVWVPTEKLDWGEYIDRTHEIQHVFQEIRPLDFLSET